MIGGSLWPRSGGEGCAGQNVYVLFRAGLPGDVLRQPKQWRRKLDVIVSYDRGSLWPRSGGEGCAGQNVYVLFRAGLPGDVLRQPKQWRRKLDVIVSYDRGVTLAQGRRGGLCRPKWVFFIQSMAPWGPSAHTKTVEEEAQCHCEL